MSVPRRTTDELRYLGLPMVVSRRVPDGIRTGGTIGPLVSGAVHGPCLDNVDRMRAALCEAGRPDLAVWVTSYRGNRDGFTVHRCDHATDGDVIERAYELVYGRSPYDPPTL